MANLIRRTEPQAPRTWREPDFVRELLGWDKNRPGELFAKSFDTREQHDFHL